MAQLTLSNACDFVYESFLQMHLPYNIFYKDFLETNFMRLTMELVEWMEREMVELNKTINWKPASTGEGRFGNWLENLVDWNLSRSRFWGTPLPIWRTEDGSEEICIGSIDELN